MDPRVVSAAKRTLRKESQEVHGKLRHVTSDELLPQVGGVQRVGLHGCSPVASPQHPTRSLRAAGHAAVLPHGR